MAKEAGSHDRDLEVDALLESRSMKNNPEEGGGRATGGSTNQALIVQTQDFKQEMASEAGNHGDDTEVDAKLDSLSLKDNPEEGGGVATGGSTNQAPIVQTQDIKQEMASEAGNHGDGVEVDAQLDSFSLKDNPEEGRGVATGGSNNQVPIVQTQDFKQKMASEAGNHGDAIEMDAQLESLPLKNNPKEGQGGAVGGYTNQALIAQTQNNTLAIQKNPGRSMSTSASQGSFTQAETYHQNAGITHNTYNYYGNAPEKYLPEKDNSQYISDEIRKLSGQEGKLTREEKFELKKHIGGNWREFGRGLGLTNAQLDEINHDYHTDGLGEKIYQILHKWESKNGKEATVGCLVQVMIRLEMVPVIKIVFSKYM